MADETQETPTTFEDTMSEAFDNIQDDVAEVPEETPQEEVPEETVDEIQDTEEETAAEEAVSETEEEVSDEPEPVDAPTSWEEKDKEHFSKLPRELQEIVVSREKQRDEILDRNSEEAKKVQGTLQQYESIVGPYRKSWQMQGMNDETALRQLLSLSDYATQNPAEFIKLLAKNNNINLDELMDSEYSYDDDLDDTDPAYNQMQQRLVALENHLAQQQNQAHQSNTQTAQNMIDEFSSAKDENGNIKYPHFEKVKPMMGDLIQSGRADNMEKAYDIAVWAEPEVRKLMMQQSSSKQKLESRKESAKKAKRAASTNVKAKGTSHVTKEATDESWEETMSKAYDQVNL
tara:strand:- start:1280 stop:2317 length:1038 start_codon:yes stop_codon:yes gene_type:complete